MASFYFEPSKMDYEQYRTACLLEERLLTKGEQDVSWFQESMRIFLDLIHATGVTTTDASIIDIGGGASRLVDALLDEGFTRTIHQLYSD